MSSMEPPAQGELRLIEAARRQVEAAGRRMLDVHARTRSSFDMPLRPLSAEPQQEFPGYEIRGEIQRGGQGVVYRAMHLATRREVAIKVLRGGRLATAQERLRFEREARILAHLRHPNVVPIHDSGVSEGHPYIVMDYIAGPQLDQYVGSRRDDPAELRGLLELFATICDAVQAAHVRGVTHRDLKPANIRVDSQGPHVLDFGLAKLTEPDSDAGGLDVPMTQTGQFLGSLPWAAPEQVNGGSDQIDLRTDVYALGVILYQMLTGAFPYPAHGRPSDMLDQILHHEPVPLRARRRELPADIETIVSKCLQKERDRRYQTAGEVARDVRHFLAGAPLDAKRDSVAYVIRKQLARHKAPVAVGLAFLLVVCVGFIVSLALWRAAASQRDAAKSAQIRASEQREIAEANETRALSEAAKAAAVTKFLQNMLQSADPGVSGGRELTVREILDKAAERATGPELANEPEVEAQIRATLGLAYSTLGRYDEADRMFNSALALVAERLPPGAPLIVQIKTGLASAHFHNGQFARAEAEYRRLLEEAQPAEPERLMIAHKLGFALVQQDKLEEALEILNPALERARVVLGEDDHTTLQIMDTLGVALRTCGRIPEAEALEHAAVDGMTRVFGPSHPVTLGAINNLSLVLRAKRDYAGAEALLRPALETATRVLGDDHPSILPPLTNLGAVLWYQEKHEESLAVAEQAMGVARRALPREHASVLNAEDNYVKTLVGVGRYDDALAMIEQLITDRRELLGETHHETVMIVDHYRDLLDQLEREEQQRAFTIDLISRWKSLAEAPGAPVSASIRYAEILMNAKPEDLRDAKLAMQAARRAEEAPNEAGMEMLASAYAMNGDFAGAVQAQRQAVELVSPTDPQRRAILQEGLAMLLMQTPDFPAAKAYLTGLVQERRTLAPRGQNLEISIALLAEALAELGELPESEALWAEVLELRTARLSPAHRVVAFTKSAYGDVIARQGRFAEAEPLLLAGYEGLRDSSTARPDSVAKARERLVRLYEQWGRPEQASTWRAQP